MPILDRLKAIDADFRDWLATTSFPAEVGPPLLREAVLAYPSRNAKRMRPALTLLAAAATGGEAAWARAREVAFALELFHTWTLVHDDIIDRDPVRRGQPTVHTLAAERANASIPDRAHYGTTVAILAGDIQHGWCNDTILNAARSGSLPAGTALTILHRLNRRVLTLLVRGELLDVDYGHLPLNTGPDALHEDAVIRMLWEKTGALYEFCGETGALIGTLAESYEDPRVQPAGRFASHLGTAFQLQDDVLGITGTASETGKPVGADLREGKKTTLVLRALRTGSAEDTRALRATLGNREATEADIAAATGELERLGCITHTRQLARQHLDNALGALRELPDSPHRSELAELAEFTLSRTK